MQIKTELTVLGKLLICISLAVIPTGLIWLGSFLARPAPEKLTTQKPLILKSDVNPTEPKTVYIADSDAWTLQCFSINIQGTAKWRDVCFIPPDPPIQRQMVLTTTDFQGAMRTIDNRLVVLPGQLSPLTCLESPRGDKCQSLPWIVLDDKYVWTRIAK